MAPLTNLPEEIGPYQVTREIGRGGMGVVYLARDTKLDRDVAIKCLPEHLSDDPDRLARFEREARSLAALNHPGIASIYGFEHVDGRQYIILEHVEGETLEQRLSAGALTVDEALAIAIQITDAIESAHENGIIHRDLKPANVKITSNDRVKVLDFGLAKALDSRPSSIGNMSDSPTVPQGASPTMPGVILGTAGYLSPEQARGRPVDKRTDIFSFGCILYEMLAGLPPFPGETATDSIGAVLHKEIELDKLRADTPPRVRRVLARCLQRDQKQRFRDIGDVRIELESPEPLAATRGGERRRTIGWIPGLAAGLVLGTGLAWLALPRSVEPVRARPAMPGRYTIKLPETAPLAPPSKHPFGLARRALDLSPDGRTLIYTALVDGRTHLYTRDMASGEVRPVPGGADGFGAIFSPSGREIAFFANERLYKMDLERRTDPEPLTETSSPAGLAWASDGTIYFGPAEQSPILGVPSSGGLVAPVTDTGPTGDAHALPHLAPGEDHLLFTAYKNLPSVNVMPIGRPAEQRTLVDFGSDGRITSSGHLLFMRFDRLMAASIDRSTLEVQRDPVTAISNVRASRASGQFVLSNDGTLIYSDGLDNSMGRFVWVDRAGQSETLDLGLQPFVAFAITRDGRHLATPIRDEQDIDIWIYDLERLQAPARITFGGVNNHARWSNDDRYLLFARHDSDGGGTIWAKDVRSGAPAFAILEYTGDLFPLQYHAPTGELLFCQSHAGRGLDQMRGFVDLSQGEGATVERIEPFRATRHGEPFAAISPDRKWIVANSDETGRWELYLSSYPDGGSRIQISTTGGEEPIWTDDGSRVIYRWNADWFEVDVVVEPRLTVSSPRVIASGPYINVPGYSWDMSPDGRRLLFLENPQQDTPITELNVITNFVTELERIAPGR